MGGIHILNPSSLEEEAGVPGLNCKILSQNTKTKAGEMVQGSLRVKAILTENLGSVPSTYMRANSSFRVPTPSFGLLRDITHVVHLYAGKTKKKKNFKQKEKQKWDHSSVGQALAWYSRGQGFNSSTWGNGRW